MRLFARPIALASVLALVAITGCTPSGTASSSTRDQSPAQAPAQRPAPAEPRSKIIFDMAHGEIFGPDDTTELGQSMAVERMRIAGFDVVVNEDYITDEDLAGASGLIVAGPMRPLTREEYVSITDFVKRGGTLLLTIHVPYPVLSVPAHWGLPVTPFVMLSEEPIPGGDPGVFVADEIEEGYLTEGVSRVFVLSGWPVSAATDNATEVVRSGPGTWIDANDNKTQEASESASYGVVGSATLGEGYVIVAGDDAIFANIAINEADNARLLDNILQLMSGTMGV